MKKKIFFLEIFLIFSLIFLFMPEVLSSTVLGIYMFRHDSYKWKIDLSIFSNLVRPKK